jgi:hypothetical protein
LPSKITALDRAYAARGLAVLAVNMGEPRELVRRWVRDRGVTARVLLDPTGAATAAYRVTGTPTVILVDRAGRLVGRAVGPREWTEARGRAVIETLLAERAP